MKVKDTNQSNEPKKQKGLEQGKLIIDFILEPLEKSTQRKNKKITKRCEINE